MKIIEIKAQSNGAHRNQTLGFEIPVPDGWAVIPDDILIPATFPFVNIAIEDNTVVSMTEGEVPIPIIDKDSIKEQCSSKIKSLCSENIINGFDADVLGRGQLHYTLTEIQQRDLQVQYDAVLKGTEEVLWRDTSRVTHETYTAEQFSQLFKTGYVYIISCKIRSDWLEQYSHDLIENDNIELAQEINWETSLPQEYQDQCDNQIAKMLNL